jgi:Fe-S cluster assembly protein SufD
MELKEQYEQILKQSLPDLTTRKPSMLNKFRKEGFDHFKESGIPEKSDENWLYTDLSPVFSKEWDFNTKGIDTQVDVESVFKCDVPNLDTHLALVFNGHYFESKMELPEGVILGSIAKISESHPQLVEKYLFKAALHEQRMTNLNAALALDGFFLYIPKNVQIDKPIQIVNAAYGNQSFFINQHNLIVAEPGSFAQIAYCDHTLSATPFFVNQLTEIFVEENATMEFYNTQNSHNDTTQVSAIYVQQKRSSNFHSNIVTLHGGLIRNELRVKLMEPGAHCDVSGINLTDRKQHVDSHTRIDHLAPHCTSNQLYKGIYDDDATGAFTGRIMVHPGAQKTQAYQSNKNMLLTSRAKVNTRPQLEIYADDVKCSHGATTGQLDPNAMFYMRARGIDKNEARMLMMYAFANEIVSKIKIQPLATRIEGLINRRLRGELSRCANCVIQCG